MEFFKPDAFLSAVLDRDACWLAAPPAPERLAGFRGECARRMADPRFFATAKVPAAEVPALAALIAAGFTPVDVNLTLSRPLRAPGTIPGLRWDGTVRQARPEDEEQVRRIAAQSLTTSRFHLDPRLDHAAGPKVKAEWAGNFFRGRRGHSMAVAEREGRVAGFLLFIHFGDTLVIDLLAVDAPFRRQGAAAAIIAFAEREMAQFATLMVGTQAANLDSVRFYEAQGLRYAGASHVLHAHGGQPSC